MTQDETIVNQQTTSNQEEQSSAQTPESSTQGQSETVDDANLIPEKFVGKSAIEIAHAYKELERDRGRISSELGSARKEREDMQQRFRDLEQSVARYNSNPMQTPPQANRQAEEVDPLSSFDTTFDEDPKKAIKEALRLQQELGHKRVQEQSMQHRAQEANQYYWNEKQTNPDYARREPIMQQLVSEFQDVIKPEYLNSKKVLQALDLMSRGKDVDFYKREAAASAQKNSSSVREEKRQASSESATSEGEQLKDFNKLSSKDMAKLLGRSDD